MSVPQTEAEMLQAFREFTARYTPKTRTNGPNPLHRGVTDPNYVPPPPSEYPRMMHHTSGMTKIVMNREEQEALGPQWHTTPVIRPADWRAKLNEVYTKSGFRVWPHHVSFLQANGISVETQKQAAEFLDQLDKDEQEQFFSEAEKQEVPEEAVKSKKK